MTHPITTAAAATGLILTLLLARPGAAEELTLSPAAVENLGIELIEPQTAERLSGMTVRGRVVVPPDGDRVVSAAQPGLVLQLHAAEGDRVNRGALLAEVRSPGFVEAQREFLDAQTTAELAQARLERDRALVAEGIVSRRRLEGTQAEAQAAAAALAENRQMLMIAGLSESDIDALAEERELRALLPVRAPVPGVVLALYGRAGVGVTEIDPLYRVADLSTLWLEIDVPGEQADLVRPGMTVVLGNGEEDVASVTSVGHSVDPHSQMVKVRATIPGDRGHLRPGQFVTAQIVDSQLPAEQTWAVPVASVIRSGNSHYVFVRTDTGFVVRPVQHLGAQGDRAFVAGELDTGTRLAATGVSALKAMWGAAADEEA